MSGTRKLRVFISHASEDNKAARALNDRLEAVPWIEPWLDEVDLLPGHNWDLEIEKAIDQADVILVCFSNESVRKEGYIQKEFKRALELAEEKPEGTIYIIPLLLDECIPPRRFDQWQRAKFSSEDDYKKLLASLELRARSLSPGQDTGPKKERPPASGSERPTRLKRAGFKAAIKIFLGMTLPVFACLVIFAAAGGRNYFGGYWTTGVNEIVITLVVYFGLIILSFILFMDGLSQITASTLDVGARIPWAKLADTMPKGTSTRDGFNRQLEALRGALKLFQTKENWLDPDFKARLKAALLSLIIPGWGLYVRGRKLLAVGFLIATTIGYLAEFMPGILLHLIVIVLSGVLDQPVETKRLDEANEM